MDAYTTDMAQYVMDESDARGIESNAYRPCNFGAVTSADHECDDECITKGRLAETALVLEALAGLIGRGVWDASHFAYPAADITCDACGAEAFIVWDFTDNFVMCADCFAGEDFGWEINRAERSR
jgi:hypothetical protein